MNTLARFLAAMALGLSLFASMGGAAHAATRAEVNGEQITDIHVSQRLKLFKLENRSGEKAALEELINEALMVQEAKRLGVTITEAQVDEAFLTVARNIRVSADKLQQLLQANGVNADTLRSRLRANLAWGQVTQRAIMPRVQISDVELDREAAKKATASNSFDYILKEVIFVMPGGKGSASKRTSEANNYRKGFRGCDSAVQLSLTYRDAAVIDVGRRHATQLPEAIATELSKLDVGGITKPRVMETGVSMLAVCSKSVAEDLTFIKGNLRQEAGTAQLKGESDKYLKEVRERSRVVYN